VRASALLASQQPHDQLSKQARKAKQSLQVELAKLDADMKRLMDRTRLDARAKAAKASAAKISSAKTSASQTSPVKTLSDKASAHPQSKTLPPMRMIATPTAQVSSDKGPEIVMAERPVARPPPAVVTTAPGIPLAPHAILISSADHSVYWSLQNSGTVYRSTDRRSWTPASTGISADLLAGMAPTSTVCWAVGRKGVILLTTDGVHWERVTSPTTSDVIGISAASKDVATIFTAGGGNYSTFDGGSNWEHAN
jgi:hypothetical protein